MRPNQSFDQANSNDRNWGGCRLAAFISPWLLSNVANWVASKLSVFGKK
tara:strand:+ start:588 stop:734 length:147 start_codon:yes stop_codon:yes gene_type:complete